MSRYPGLEVERIDLNDLNREIADRKFHRILSVADVLTNYALQLGMGRRMNTAVIDSTRPWLRRRLAQTKLGPLRPLLDLWVGMARRNRLLRSLTRSIANATVPTGFWRPILKKHRPDLVVTAGLGWSTAEYGSLKESRRLGIGTATVITGWDHTSNRGIPRFIPDHTLAWSQAQKSELIAGSDVPGECIETVGSAHFDRYAEEPEERQDRTNFFNEMGLDPNRKLITFACTFVAISSNAEIVEALAKAVDGDQLEMPSQLLIRLHPTHLKSGGEQREIVGKELMFYQQLEATLSHVHLQFPEVEDGTAFNVASDADTAFLSNLLGHTDVLVTLFSTMVLEASIKDLPVVTAAIAPSAHWRWDYTWDITKALNWPTHERILKSGATITAYTLEEMVEGVREALRYPARLHKERAAFSVQETFKVDGQSGRRIGMRLYELAERT
jgi:hypothetical protein